MALFSAYVVSPKKSRFEGQEKGEKILLLLRRHFITNLRWVLVSVFLALVPTALPFLELEILNGFSIKFRLLLAIVWYLITLIYIFENFLNWYFNVYIITNKRIVDIDFWGLLYRNVSEANLANVEDVTHKVGGVSQTIFNYGDVLVQTAAERSEFDFHGVPHPGKVHDKLTDMIDAAKHRGKKYK